MKITNTTAITALLLAGASTTASAVSNYQLFTNRAAWESALGAITTETFNSFGVDTPANVAVFNGFTLSGTGASLDGGPNVFVDIPSGEYGLNISNPAVNFAALSTATLTFNSPKTAVGFDTINYDFDSEKLQVFINGTPFQMGFFPLNEGETGFLGAIGLFGNTISTINFAGSGDTFNAMDNVSFSSTVDVPFGVDSTAGLALLGLAAGWKMRRRKTS